MGHSGSRIGRGVANLEGGGDNPEDRVVRVEDGIHGDRKGFREGARVSATQAD